MCNEVWETTPASSWCSDCEMTLCHRCVQMHLKGPATKKHDLFDLSEGPKVKQRRKAKCKEHDEELITFVCKDCNKAICQLCCILKHSKHNHATIESMVPEIKSALTVKRGILEQQIEESASAVRREESRIEQLSIDEKSAEGAIISTTKTAITLLRKREKDLLKELKDVSSKQIAEHRANVKAGQITTQMHQQHREFIDQALQSKSWVDMYDMYQVCLSGVVESAVDATNTSGELEVKFTSNIEQLRQAIANIGKISSGAFLTGNNSLDTMTPVLHDTMRLALHDTVTTLLHDTIDVKHAEDTHSADPIDVTVVTVWGVQTVVVFADFWNECLKSISMKKHKNEIFRLNLSGTPYRITKMTENRIAATVSNKQIVIAEVRPKLLLNSTLKTSKQYWGLSSLSDSKLAAGSNSPSAVDILDLKGNVLKSFTPHNTGLNAIRWPHYLCTTHESNILVADYDSTSVYCLTPNGGIVFIFTSKGDINLRFPRGIAVTCSGDILLSVSVMKRIIQLTSDGTFVRYIPTCAVDIGEPWGLCVDDTDKLYMCKRDSDSSIKVFNLA